MGHRIQFVTKPTDVSVGEEISWIHSEWGWMNVEVVRVNKLSVTVRGPDEITRRVTMMRDLAKNTAQQRKIS